MTEFITRFANQTAQIKALYPSTRTHCKDYLSDNAVPDFHIQITPQDITYERQKSAREDELEGNPIRNLPDSYLEITAVQRKLAEQLFAYDTLLFHGSVVAVDGQAYLFTAKSGTGKSTHTRLWREVFGERAVMINDDKPFLKAEQEGIRVYGSPWNGKHGLGTNTSAPLKSICILKRGNENTIRQIAAKDALFMLMQQSHRPMQPQLMPKYMELLDRIAKGVTFYEMSCNMDPEAARIAYEGMCGLGKDDAK